MKKDKLSLFLLIFLVLIVFIGNFQVDVKVDADDVKYQKYSEKNLVEYTSFMYTKQNGRIIPNIMEYILFKFNLVIIWRIVNTLMVLLLAYAIARLNKLKVEVKDVNLLLILFFAMSTTLLSSCVFGFTMSLNYLWPTTLMVFALIPISDYFFRNIKISLNKNNVICFICASLVMLSSEQLSCLILAFYILTFFYSLIIRKENFYFKKIIPIIILLLIFCIMVFSPAQNYRYERTQEKYKETWDLPLLEKTQNAIVWSYNQAFNENKLLLFIFAITIILVYKENINGKIIRILYDVFKYLTVFAFCAVILLYQKYAYFINIYDYIFLFEKITVNNMCIKTIFPYFFWSTYFIIELILVFNFSKNRFLDLIIIASAICTIIILWFSPTMYASGGRTWFAWAIIHIFLIYKIYYENNKQIDKMIACIPITNIILLILVLMKNYVIYY